MAKKGIPTKEKVCRWLNIQNMDKVYFALQFVFVALQCLLLFVCLEGSINPLLPLVYCAVLLLLAWKSKNTACRVFMRAIPALVLTVVLAAIVGFFVVAKDVTGVVPLALSVKERIGFSVSYLVTVFQPLWLLSLPALAIAARVGGKKMDIVLLHSGAWAMLVFSIGTLLLKYNSSLTGYTLMFKGLSLSFFTAEVLLWVYVIASLALVFAVFMLYPFGIKRIKALVDKTRAASNED